MTVARDAFTAIPYSNYKFEFRSLFQYFICAMRNNYLLLRVHFDLAASSASSRLRIDSGISAGGGRGIRSQT